MLQTIKKTLHSATPAFAFGVAIIFSACVPAALAQEAAPAQTPQTSQTSQSSQTSTAAPGTAPLPKATASALAPYTGPKYDNRWEVYGGLSFMNGQAGQNLPSRYNMGGVEAMGTYWLTNRFGAAADYRFGAGTTPVINPDYNRVVVMQSIISGGVQMRGPKNRYAAIDFHALAGGSQGIFDYATNHYPGGSPYSSCPNNTQPGQKGNLGLYCNHVAPWGTAGGSIDFNESAKLAIRLQPDMIFEHFGTETREFFSISAGVVYRLGKR